MNILHNLLLWASDKLMEAKVNRYIDIILEVGDVGKYMMIASDSSQNIQNNTNDNYGYYILYNSAELNCADYIFIKSRVQLTKKQKKKFFEKIDNLPYDVLLDYIDCSSEDMLRALLTRVNVDRVSKIYDIPEKLKVEMQLKGLL